MGEGRYIDLRRDFPLTDHVQAPHARRMLRNRLMMFRQIVDEEGGRRAALSHDRGQGFALGAMIPMDRKVEAVGRQLLDPLLVMPLADIGENHNVGDMR
jgi:hypothetical protein